MRIQSFYADTGNNWKDLCISSEYFQNVMLGVDECSIVADIRLKPVEARGCGVLKCKNVIPHEGIAPIESGKYPSLAIGSDPRIVRADKGAHGKTVMSEKFDIDSVFLLTRGEDHLATVEWVAVDPS